MAPPLPASHTAGGRQKLRLGPRTILCYHSVEPAWSSPLAVEPELFHKHCSWLAARGLVVGLAEAVARLSPYGAPRGVTALTFDDGFASVYEHAFPVLVRYGLPATFFVVAGTLAGDGLPVTWVDTPPSWPLRTLSPEQVLEMQEAGFDFGSHSYAHHDLTQLSEKECEQDLRASRELLEDLIRRRVPFLAYPRGRHNELVRRAAERAGFSRAFTLPEAPEPVGPFSIPRAGVFLGNGLWSLRAKSSHWYVRARTSRAYPVLRMVLKGRRPPRRLPG
jgi:peptidoglycan/xylan/chitin deacetylase (PgdA/CDA1 family)